MSEAGQRFNEGVRFSAFLSVAPARNGRQESTWWERFAGICSDLGVPGDWYYVEGKPALPFRTEGKSAQDAVLALLIEAMK